MQSADSVFLPVLAPATAEERVTFLGQIPSAATPAGRALLFEHFSVDCSGDGTMVDIGPFLGGTTRVVARGMTSNPHLATDAVFHTFDRFDACYSAEPLGATIEPMVPRGIFIATQADELCSGANFERLFSAIHVPHAYSSLARLHNSPLPERPTHLPGGKMILWQEVA